MASRRFRIVICRGPDCGERRGSAVLHEAFTAAIARHGAAAQAEVAWQSCFGRCTQGPNVLVREVVESTAPTLGVGLATLPGPRGLTALYNHIDVASTDRIVSEHVVQGRIARELIDKPEAGILRSLPVASKDSEP